MISPSSSIALLPQDREIMDLAGLSESEYRWFVRQCIKNAKLRPCEPVAIGIDVILLQILIAVVLTGAAYLLTPKPKAEERSTPKATTVDGQDVVRRDRFASKSGFDSVQNVVEMGSVIPIIYCKREEVNGEVYGGLRVNTNLLWSQLLSIGGGQNFKGVYMIGEGPLTLEQKQIALGNNMLSGYELAKDLEAGRISIYYSQDGGRLSSADYERGVLPEFDLTSPNLRDIYSVEDANGIYSPDFCQAIQPTNQSEFGVYELIGNNLGYKIGEDFQVMSQWDTREDGEYERTDDNQRVALRKKQSVMFSTRAGFVSTQSELLTLAKNDIITYAIYKSSEKDREFIHEKTDTAHEDGKESNDDTGTTIASLQRSYDESINVGDIYKAGSATVICISRSDDPCGSEADVTDAADASDVTAQFKVIRAGKIHVWTSADLQPTESGYATGKLATTTSHLLKISVAAFSTERACRIIEVGFRSRLGLSVSGVANFNSLRKEKNKEGHVGYLDNSYQAYVDAEYCGGQNDGDNPEVKSYRNRIEPGSHSAPEIRYSFFRILYRNIDDDAFTELQNLYGFRGQTSADFYNAIRFDFGSVRRREIRFVPVSGWEVRNEYTSAELHVIDSHVADIATVTDQGVALRFNGTQVPNTASTFEVKGFINPNISQALASKAVVSVTALQADGITPLVLSPTQQDDVEDAFYITLADPAIAVVDWNYTIATSKLAFLTSGQTITATFSVTTKDDFETSVSQNIAFLITRTGATLGISVVGGASGAVVGSNLVITGSLTFTGLNLAGRVQLGLAPHDDPANYSYVDGWARLAEAFVYSEVTSSARQPEHSISYVNMISENKTTPDYANMAILGLNIRSSNEIRSLDQLSVYVSRGVINSHAFPDVFYDLLTNQVYGVGKLYSSKQIDKASFDAASTWTRERLYFFDGAISSKINVRSWGVERARDFLLELGISGGRFTLKPALDFDQPLQIAALFTSGNILEDTLQVSYFEPQDRSDPLVTVRWREERTQGVVSDRGLFPIVREVGVRRADAKDGDDAPILQIDMSDFCTNQRHAIDRAKYECQLRRYVTHSVGFKTVPTQAMLSVGSIIKLGIETVYYNQPQNGAISSTGEVTSWEPLADGEYPVLLWDGITLQETTIDIRKGRTKTVKNAVFCLQTTSVKADTYRIQSIGFDEDGNVDIEAIYWPVDSAGFSRLVSDFDDENFVLEGAI